MFNPNAKKKNLVERAGFEPATRRLEVDNPRASAQRATHSQNLETKILT